MDMLVCRPQKWLFFPVGFPSNHPPKGYPQKAAEPVSRLVETCWYRPPVSTKKNTKNINNRLTTNGTEGQVVWPTASESLESCSAPQSHPRTYLGLSAVWLSAGRNTFFVGPIHFTQLTHALVASAPKKKAGPSFLPITKGTPLIVLGHHEAF